MEHFDSVTSEAYEMYHFLVNFIVKYEIYGEKPKERFKLLLGSAFGSDDRALEAAVGQFIAQLDHINA
jgi:hypothetical protein